MKKLIPVIVCVLLALCACAKTDDKKPSQAADELTAILQEKIDKIALSGIFASDFDGSASDNKGYYLYSSGAYILGDSLEETYQYTSITILNDHYDAYPYTPADVMDAALQEYFAISPENLHSMIANYKEDIDGYMAPMGGGGITAATTIINCEVDGTVATLSCETSTSPSEEDPTIPSTIIMEYSDEYGWRFVSCTVS